MKRRKFLLLTTAGAIATMTPFCKSRHATPSALNTPEFLAAICDAQTIRKIGTDYRTTTNDESREGQLTDLLTAGFDQNKDQTQQITNRVKDDFASNRIMTLEGYVISVTEARQCALFSIQNP
jgi:hypothetical protein